MTWLQLELSAGPAELPDIEQALYNGGAVSITLVSDVDEPVLEPAPGEIPLWSSVRVQALLPLDADIGQIRHALVDVGAWQDASPDITFIAEQDWQVAATNHAVNQVFAERLWLLPKNTEVKNEQNYIQLRLEPGLAFGSGSHATTRLCLNWLAQHVQPGMRVLDFGCGSGVLGIAAALLGAEVVAVDHDEQAILATHENAAYNNLSPTQVRALLSQQWHSGEFLGYFDVIVANILAAPLQLLAPEFERVLAANGTIVLSGVLQDQAEDVMSSYQQTSFKTPELEAGWACLVSSQTRITT